MKSINIDFLKNNLADPVLTLDIWSMPSSTSGVQYTLSVCIFRV